MVTQGFAQDETWDDSDLVRSWNDALDEYKKYHSIAAKGERVEDVLDDAEKNEEGEGNSNNMDDASLDEATGLPHWQPVKADESVDVAAAESEVQNVNGNVSHAPLDQPSTAVPASSSDVPQALLNSVTDENLKNLMMSWYYAGYYTGLHEGQQKAHDAR